MSCIPHKLRLRSSKKLATPLGRGVLLAVLSRTHIQGLLTKQWQSIGSAMKGSAFQKAVMWSTQWYVLYISLSTPLATEVRYSRELSKLQQLSTALTLSTS